MSRWLNENIISKTPHHQNWWSWVEISWPFRILAHGVLESNTPSFVCGVSPGCWGGVGVPTRGGYEIYPHHQRFLDLWTQHSCLQSSAHPELSAVEGEANAASGDRVTASRVTRCALGRGEAGEAEVRGVGD